MTSPDKSDAAAVETALADCVSLIESSGWPAVGEYLSSHAECAMEVETRLSALVDLGLIEGPDDDRPDYPDRLGEFRLLERLGGGGMGVVFRAEQPELGREVALKLMRPDHLYFADSRERFRREAEAVARLHHPGIVPVYAFGEESGLPYFAMELVEGRTFGEMIGSAQKANDNMSTDEVATCARLAAQVADALEHAHARGVLHRDVKPTNVMVSATGRAMLVDFGLARTEGESRITRSGGVTGSLPYVAPEIIRGDGPGWTERSDVYSLGVTLYELLTSVCPYLGQSAEETRRRIVEGRPDAIRRTEPRVSRELEVVCLTAMDRDANRRYASAADFARDLRNVLERRPVEARAPGLLLAIRRWVQRHPTLAASFGLVALLLAAVPLALLVQSKGHERDLEDSLVKVRGARQDAVREGRRAEEKAKAAEEAMAFIMGVFSEGGSFRSGGRPANALDLVRIGVKRARSELSDVPEVRAFILYWLGKTLIELENHAEAAELLEEAVALVRELPDQHFLHGRALVKLADAVLDLGELDRAEQLIAEAAPLLEGQRGAQRGSVKVVSGRIAISAQRWHDAETHFLEALALFREDPEARPYGIATIRANIATARHRQGRLTDAIAMNREALADLRRAIEGPHPSIARVLASLGLMLKLAGELDEATQCYEDAIAMSTTVLGEDSFTVAGVRLNLGALLLQRGNLDASHKSYSAALRVFEARLPENHPARVECQSSLGAVNSRLGRFADIAAAFPRIIELQIEIEGAEHAKVVYSRVRYAEALMNLGRGKEAVKDLEIACASKNPVAANPAVKAHHILAGIHFQAGRMKEAKAVIQRGIEFIDANRAHLAPQEWPPFRKMLVSLLETLGQESDGR